LFGDLTPCVPLSFEGEGDLFKEEGLTPLLNAPRRLPEPREASPLNKYVYREF